ncbi:MAG: transporter substrate-binding domain-containing protein [bacterium]|jgi:PAS domain S-box-containing protein|nr:transporter substrate-binding domain-containing protein [bacterium]
MWTHGFQFAGYYAAIAQGFYEEEGIQVELKERLEELYNVEAVLAGEAEYGISDAGLLLYRMEGKPVVLLGQIYQHSPLIFMSKRDSGIVGPFEMTGKRVLMDLRVKYEAPLYAMIEQILGGISKIHAIQHTFDYEDFLEGKADAIATFITDQPFLMKQRGVEINIINPQSYGMDFYGDNLFTTEKEIQHHPGRADRVLRATLKGWEYALSHQEEIIEWIQQNYPNYTQRDLLEYEARMVELLILAELIPLGDINPARYNWAASTFFRLGMATTESVPEGFFYSAKPQPTLSMKPEDKDWLAAHPQIRIGVMNAWPPLNFVDDSGTLQGIGVDYIGLLNKRLGNVLQIEASSFDENLRRVQSKEIDALMDITPRPEREETLSFTTPYLTIPHVLVGRNEDVYFDSETDLAGKTVAVESGYYNIAYLRQNYPEIVLKEYASTRDALDAVSRSEADAYIGNRAVVIYLIDKELFTNLQVMGRSAQAPVELSIGIRKDWPELLSILNQALDSITQEEYRAVRRKWTGLDQDAANFAPEPMISEVERRWLQEHRAIRLGVDPYHPPFDFFDATQTHSGVASDYVNLLNHQLNIAMEPVIASSWQEVLEMIQKGEVDALPCIAKTPTRLNYLIFTKPFLQVPLVILTRENSPYVSSLDDFGDERVAVIQGYASQEFLHRDYPDKKLLLVQHLDEALQMVSKGKADAFVGDIESIQFSIKKLGLLNLRIAATTPYKLEFAFAVRKDWPELVAILDKALQGISETEKLRFLDRWTQFQVERLTDWGLVWRVALLIVAISTLILGIILYWNRRLAREIVERKRIETALRESEEKYRTLVQNLNIGVYRNTGGSVGRFIEANPAMMQIFGYASEEEFLRVSVSSLYIDPQNRQHFIKEISEHGSVLNKELHMKRKDGTLFWASCTAIAQFDPSGAIRWIDGVLADITERKKLDEQLHHYEFIINSVRVMLSLVSRDYRYDAVNNEYCLSLQKPRDTILGHCVDEMWGEELFERSIRPHFERCFRGEALNHETWIPLPRYGNRYCEITFLPYRDENDKVTHAVVMIHDITHRKQAEEKLQQATQAADAANQAKSVFLANMSHEIRTPMNAILGYTQLLQRDKSINKQQREFIATINRSGEHLMALINDVLEMSKIESGRVSLNRQAFDLHALLQDFETMFRFPIEKKQLRFEISRAESLPRYLFGDEGKIRQVLINIVGNAIKFTDEGHITVRAFSRLVSGQNDFTLAPNTEFSAITIDVEDTGCGIAAHELEQVFSQFDQTESGRTKGMGTGLGMAISRQYARMMGGDITVQSAWGKGSVFRFTFLVENHDEELGQVRPSVRQVDRLAPGQEEQRILVVDDRDTNRDLLARMLTRAGFLVQEVEDGYQAIDAFQRWHPHMIFMDMVMPGIDGCETMRRIRTLPDGKEIPILMVSASALVEDLNKAIEAGADGFIRKPFREQELFREIERHTNVQFLYEESEPRPDQAEADLAHADAGLCPEALAALPPELIDTMLVALKQGYVNKLNEQIEEVAAIDARIATALAQMADAFEFDTLKVWLEGARNAE